MLKVGDELRILVDEPHSAELTVGDIVEVFVPEPDEDGDIRVYGPDGRDWWLRLSSEGKTWERTEAPGLVTVETVTRTITEPVYVLRLSRYDAELLEGEFAATPTMAGGPLHHALVAALAND